MNELANSFDADNGNSGALEETRGLSQAQADWRPSEKDWSVGEVVHHLILAEVATGKLTTKLTRDAEASGAARGFPADLTAFKLFPAPPPGAASPAA